MNTDILQGRWEQLKGKARIKWGKLTNDDIVARIQQAFRPLRCVAVIWDYDAKLRFKVFDPQDRGVIEVPSVVLRDIREWQNLKSLLNQARVEVENKGFRLEPLGD